MSLRQQHSNGWTQIPSEQVDAWNQRLLQTDASVFQYPYWNEPARRPYFSPQYLVYGSLHHPAAYVCLLRAGVPGVSIGVVVHGPVNLLADSANRMVALQDLVRWAKRHGYVFLRFTDTDHQFVESVASSPLAKRVDAFPFHHGGFGDDLVVEQLEDDEAMLASFRPTARYQIRRAQRLGYRLEVTDSPERFTELWPLFEVRAKQKGYEAGSPVSSIALVRGGRRSGCVRVYVAYRFDRPVQAILLIRDRATAYYIAGAIDATLPGKSSDSPSCLLHWSAMRDFYRLGVKYYSLGGGSLRWWREAPFYQFKRKFNPVERVYPSPVTIVTNPILYYLWSAWGQHAMSTVWPRIRPIARRLISGRRRVSSSA